MTPSQLDDSLKAPWTRTIVGFSLVCARLGAAAIRTATPLNSRAACLSAVETLPTVLSCFPVTFCGAGSETKTSSVRVLFAGILFSFFARVHRVLAAETHASKDVDRRSSISCQV